MDAAAPVAAPKRRWLKRVLVALAALAALPFLVVLGFWLFNFDERLLPEARAAIEVPEPLFDPGNGFYALLGLLAAEDADYPRVAHASVVQARRRTSAGLSDSQPEIGIPQRDRLPIGAFEVPCAGNRPSCISPALANTGAAGRWIREHVLIWERYDRAVRAPRYEEPRLAGIPSYHPFFLPGRVAQQRVLELWKAGRIDEALELHKTHEKHCRRVLRGGQSLISKLLTTNCLERHWQLAVVLAIERPAVAATHRAHFDALLAPLDPRAMDLQPTLMSEFRFLARALLDADDAMRLSGEAPTWWSRLLTRAFFLPNATVNRRFREMQRVAQTAAQPDSELSAGLVSLEEAAKEATLFDVVLSRNLIGNVVLGITPVSFFNEYVRRLRGIEATRRLAALSFDCAVRGTLPAKPEACAESAPADLLHPFSGGPPTVDAQQGWLVYEIDASPTARNPTIDFRFDLAGKAK